VTNWETWFSGSLLW